MKEVSLNYELRSETGIYYLNKVMEQNKQGQDVLIIEVWKCKRAREKVDSKSGNEH